MAPLLQLSGVRKAFGGARALVNAELELHVGQVTALIGENGAGKSTLVKILTGVHQPDAGEIRLAGQPLRIASPVDAARAGIAVIHQESVVFDELSVAENIFAAEMPRRGGLIDWTRMHKESRRLLATLECDLDPDTLLGELSIGKKHLVQIARALSHEARVVIMDEPTAALSFHEAGELLKIVRGLCTAGRAVLYISHKFEEIMAIADRYAVFRDGEAVGAGLMSGFVAGTALDQLVALMVGRPVGQVFPKSLVELGPEVLRVTDLARASEFDGISFSLRRGEILGIYGLVGAGRSEVAQAIFGLAPADAGQVHIDQQPCKFHAPEQAIAARLAYVPEDRAHQGAILSRSIVDNVALPSLRAWSRWSFNDCARQQQAGREWIERLRVKCLGPEQTVQALSGGNQQKVVLARWLATAPRVLILDEPTKGIDIGSKATVHQFMSEWVQQGLAVILISSELPEVLGMADRILVMRHGRISAEFSRAEATPETILRAATDA